MSNGISGDRYRFSTIDSTRGRPSTAPVRPEAPERMATDRVQLSQSASLPETLAELKAVIGSLEERVAELENRVDARIRESEANEPSPARGVDAAGAQASQGESEPTLALRVRQVFDANDRAAAALALNTSNQPADRVNAELDIRGQVMGALQGFDASGLNQDEQKVAEGAIARFGEISEALAKGEEPEQFAGEVFALRHTVQNPAQAGAQRAVTTGAQVMDRLVAVRADLYARLDAIAAAGPKAAQSKPGLDPKPLLGQMEVVQALEIALQDANFSKLSEAEDAQMKASLTKLMEELPDPERNTFQLTPERLDEVLTQLSGKASMASTEAESAAKEAQTTLKPQSIILEDAQPEPSGEAK